MKRRPRSVILLCATFALLVAFGAHALTFTVNDTADTPDETLADGLCSTKTAHTCTLRAAVMQANVTGGASVTISLPAGTFGLLVPVLGSDGDYEGDLNLQSPASAISILGAGPDQTIIDGNGLFRIFAIADGRNVTISGVTLRNGYAGSGGAITAQNGTLVVSDCVFEHNAATSGSGGAISQSAGSHGSLTVNGALFIENTATGGDGGAIRAWGANSFDMKVTLAAVEFTGNSATGDGGAVAALLASVIASDSTFIANHAQNAAGGATSISGGIALGNFNSSTISRCALDSNTAVEGGAIALHNSMLSVDKSTISNNSGAQGGGISLSDFGFLTVTSSTIAANHAGGFGGGVKLDNTSGAALSSSTVARNDNSNADTGSGGGFYNLGNISLRNTLVAGNTVGGVAIPNDCSFGASGALNAYGSNLFTSAAAIAGCPVTIQTGGNYGYLNDLATLGPLQDSGGATQTIALKKGSNAIDAGDSLAGCVDGNLQPITTDQRGLTRAVGLRCDIGAFEYGADSLFASGFESTARLVINEVDYDSVGTDTAEFIEIRNNGPGPASLSGVAIVLVNGAGGAEYSRIDLSGAMELAAGAYLVVHSANVVVPGSAKSILFPGDTDQVQNGSPDGIALIQTSPPALLDALSYEGSIAAAQIVGFSAPVSLLEGTPLAIGVADSTLINGSLGRFPDGVDTNDSNTDWSFRSTPTPGAANQ